MRSFDPRTLDPAIRLAGILDAHPTADGVLLSRLTAAAQAQIIDPALLWTATMPSGGRIEMVSDTTAIEVDVQLTRLAWGADDPMPAPVDLVVDGEVVAGERAEAGHTLRLRDRRGLAFDLEPGAPVTIRFDGLTPVDKHLEVWLPNNASVELLAVRIDDGATLSPPPPADRRWAHYGSSISHCAEADRPTGVWPVIAARRAGVDLQSLAIAGQCQLDQFTARTIRDLDVDLISLKVGINVVNGDTLRERTFVPALHGFLDTIRDGHPTTPIVMITPIVCPVVEDHPGPTVADENGQCQRIEPPLDDVEGALTLRRIRQLIELVVAARRAGGDDDLHLLSGLDLFGPDDLAELPDGLHPNPAGYARMGERFHDYAFAPGGPFADALTGY
ncbi:MAG: hypothetical protein JWN46_1145 [Acidimicrobiales bacterium]|nr:hypothetical protein [Acidimicrobiales bacterium]